jgi:type II protein arginine methyltransferase
MMDLNAIFADAVARQNAGDWPAAEGLYRKIDKKQPGLAPVCWNLGVVLKAQGRWADALDAFQRAGKADPKFRGLHFNIGLCQQKLARTDAAAESFARAVEAEPDDPVGRFNLAAAYRDLERFDDAVFQVERALELKPDFLDAELLRTKLRTRMLPLWHVPMVNDAPRNDAYEAAIRAHVRPGDLVLEIGTGSGLLAMMAARAGAQVVTCEAVPWIADAARHIVAQNGLSDRITVVNCLSTALQIGVDLPRPADVLLSEIIASDFLSERVLPAVTDAKARLLRPDARILPERGGVRVALAGGALLEKHLYTGQINGFDLSGFNRLFPRAARYDARLVQPQALSATTDPFSFDFTAATLPSQGRAEFTLTASTTGRCAALAQWIWLDFGHGITFENSPFCDNPASGWQPGFFLPSAPFIVEEGDPVPVAAMHDGVNVWLSLQV